MLTARRASYERAARTQTQAEAAEMARRGRIGVVMAGRRMKLAVFQCPCGCDEILRVNLMRESGRAWRGNFDKKARFSLYPSVRLRGGCMSHFILRDNTATVFGGRLAEGSGAWWS